jgi:hypothetical protein
MVNNLLINGLNLYLNSLFYQLKVYVYAKNRYFSLFKKAI